MLRTQCLSKRSAWRAPLAEEGLPLPIILFVDSMMAGLRTARSCDGKGAPRDLPWKAFSTLAAVLGTARSCWLAAREKGEPESDVQMLGKRLPTNCLYGAVGVSVTPPSISSGPWKLVGGRQSPDHFRC